MELFSGTQSISKEFRARGHETFTVDFDEIFQEPEYENTDLFIDILKVTPEMILEKLGQPDVIWASPPCFTGETLVLTDKGFKKIEDVRHGDKVMTHKNRYKTVSDIGRKKVDDIRIIKPSCSHAIKTTDNHPFYSRVKKRIWNNDKRGWDRVYEEPRWVEAENLTKQHMIGVPINQESKLPDWSGYKMPYKNQYGAEGEYDINTLRDYFNNEDFWWIVGRYIGDGWLRENENDGRYSVTICCSYDEEKEITTVLDRLGEGFKYTIYEERTVKKIVIYKKELVLYLKQFGKYAHGKKITGDIINLPQKLIKAFINGYLSADGYTDVKSNGVQYVTATTVSKELAYGVGQCILKAYNLPYSILKQKSRGQRIIEGRKVNTRDIYAINFVKDAQKCHSFIEDGILWTNIKKIKSIKQRQFVYNITVEEDNTYTANGVIVHNCQAFSVAAIGRNWTKDGDTYTPKTDSAILSMRIVQHTLWLIQELKPKYWFMENPRGMLRKMDFVQKFDRFTITYCQYGDERMKPTDIWHNHPNPQFKPPCKNGSPCHVAAPRGSSTGTQGLKNAIERARIPEDFCKHIVKISEK